MQKTIALALATLFATALITDVNAQAKKKEKPAEPTAQSGVSPTLREQAKSQAPTVGGRNGCTAWHISSGAPC